MSTKTTRAQRLARRFKTPRQVQRFLRDTPYNRERNGETLASAEKALSRGRMHCFEAAFVAAAILENHGYPPLIVSLESKDGLDHIIYVFQEKGRWGAIARSRDEGLHGRAPVYRSLRDLAWSYYDPYVDKSGKIKAYQLAHLDDCAPNWRDSARNVWRAEKYLIDLRHRPLRSSPARYKRLLKDYRRRGALTQGKNWW